MPPDPRVSPDGLAVQFHFMYEEGPSYSHYRIMSSFRRLDSFLSSKALEFDVLSITLCDGVLLKVKMVCVCARTYVFGIWQVTNR